MKLLRAALLGLLSVGAVASPLRLEPNSTSASQPASTGLQGSQLATPIPEEREPKQCPEFFLFCRWCPKDYRCDKTPAFFRPKPKYNDKRSSTAGQRDLHGSKLDNGTVDQDEQSATPEPELLEKRKPRRKQQPCRTKNQGLIYMCRWLHRDPLCRNVGDVFKCIEHPPPRPARSTPELSSNLSTSSVEASQATPQPSTSLSIVSAAPEPELLEKRKHKHCPKWLHPNSGYVHICHWCPKDPRCCTYGDAAWCSLQPIRRAQSTPRPSSISSKSSAEVSQATPQPSTSSSTGPSAPEPELLEKRKHKNTYPKLCNLVVKCKWCPKDSRCGAGQAGWDLEPFPRRSQSTPQPSSHSITSSSEHSQATPQSSRLSSTTDSAEASQSSPSHSTDEFQVYKPCTRPQCTAPGLNEPGALSGDQLAQTSDELQPRRNIWPPRPWPPRPLIPNTQTREPEDSGKGTEQQDSPQLDSRRIYGPFRPPHHHDPAVPTSASAVSDVLEDRVVKSSGQPLPDPVYEEDEEEEEEEDDDDVE